MAGKVLVYGGDILKLIFNGTAIANLADNAAASPFTNLYVSLHTADPGTAGNQSTNEISYTGYARVAVARTTGGWTVTNNVVQNVANIVFGLMTAGTGGTVTHIGIGTVVSGATKLLYSFALTPNQSVTNGVTPTIASGSTVTEA